jgi:hypothetical protein
MLPLSSPPHPINVKTTKTTADRPARYGLGIDAFSLVGADDFTFSKKRAREKTT